MLSSHRLLTTFAAGALAALLVTPHARACAHQEPLPEPSRPAFVEPTEASALARPLALKFFEDGGQRYWRAQYEVYAWASRSSLRAKPERVVVEWSCDRAPLGEDLCGQVLDRALPGFGPTGQVDSGYVQLELRYRHSSGFDGVELYYASRYGSMRLPDPPPVLGHVKGCLGCEAEPVRT